MKHGEAVDLTGLVDPHVHSAPEHVPRLLDDLSLVRQARDAGVAGVLLKSHTTLTADRAVIARYAVPDISVWGGLVLNRSVGGLNPAAVETALAYGAAEVWMPTIDATNHRRFYRQSGPDLSLMDEEGKISNDVHEILTLVGEHDIILGTGHLSVREIILLIRAGREHSVCKILVTHPEAPFVAMPLDIQRELAAQGVRFERTWVFTTPALGAIVTADALTTAIHEVGVDSTILATDMGQIGNPSPVEGFRAYVQACLDAGFSEQDVHRMGGQSIKEWLPPAQVAPTSSSP